MKENLELAVRGALVTGGFLAMFHLPYRVPNIGTYGAVFFGLYLIAAAGQERVKQSLFLIVAALALLACLVFNIGGWITGLIWLVGLLGSAMSLQS